MRIVSLIKYSLNKYSVIFLILSSLLLSACGAAVIGGAAVGVSVSTDRRSNGTIIDDQTRRYTVIDLLNKDPRFTDKNDIGVSAYNEKILLTGKASSDTLRQAAANIAAHVKGVSRVYNEIVVGQKPTVSELSHDSWLTSRIKLALLSIKIEGFEPTLVKVVTANSTVFLMGIVDDKEGAAVIDQARHVSGVKKVVNLFDPK